MSVELRATRCAICGTEGEATELYPARYSDSDFNEAIFSARRAPDRIHYRLVRCNRCGLVRSDPIATEQALSYLYAGSDFDYEPETLNLQRTYGRALRRLEALGVRKGSLLEIGSGNGFFLEEALRQGYAEVTGVEPSRKAIAAARNDIRPRLVCDVMHPGLFAPDSFDAICMFQLFDHISDPRALLAECLRILKPSGMLLALNHDAASFSARLLGERSPIFDIEHTYLYDRTTMPALFRAARFAVREGGTVRNTYSLAYLVHLLPIPRFLRRLIGAIPGSHRVRLTVPLGNQYLVAQREPRSGETT
jgi:SAM-dependent methyltransferase